MYYSIIKKAVSAYTDGDYFNTIKLLFPIPYNFAIIKEAFINEYEKQGFTNLKEVEEYLEIIGAQHFSGDNSTRFNLFNRTQMHMLH